MMELSVGLNFCLLFTLFSFPACFGLPVAPVLLKNTEANQILLPRYRRANTLLEELKQGDLERECLEEKCSYEEAREIYPDRRRLEEFWRTYTAVDHCQSKPCMNGATCVSHSSTYICICLARFEGRNCDIETRPQTFYSCLYKNGGCEHFCTETADSAHHCDCAPGYALGQDNTSCLPQVPFPCGRPAATTLGPRIVKGTVCPKGQCPWQALLASGATFKCGAIVLSDVWILTAAHCVWQQRLSQLEVTVGEHIRFIKEKTEQIAKVSQIFIHPQYNHTTADSDIALLLLRKNITLGPYVVPICLPPKGMFDRTLAAIRLSTVSGWGRLSQSGSTSTVLQKLEVPRVPLDNCRAHSGLHLTNNMLCAGFLDGGQDACQGDSGGPLVTRYKNTSFLIGIVSWGKGCARANMYGIYTRVALFVEWITNTTAAVSGKSCCS